MTEKEKARKIAEAAPPLSGKEIIEINSRYTPYIFRSRKKREIWTTCCGRHEIIPKRECTDSMAAVMAAEHQSEIKPVSFGCHMGYIEMNGGKMAQIHGYNNDEEKEIPPEEEYAGILEPWLAWLAAGSRRGEDGKPITPKPRKKIIEIRESAAIAG